MTPLVPAGRRRGAFAALRGAVLTGALLSALSASANVYSWQDDDGALHFTNMARQVPEVYRTVTKSDGGATEPEWKVDVETATPVPRAPQNESEKVAGGESYADGVRAGLEAATDNVRAVGEVLDRLLDRESERRASREAARETSRDDTGRRVPILDPAPRSDEPRVIVRVVGRDDDRFVRYGALGPYAIGSPSCCSDSLGYGFAYGSFPPHSHFEPTPQNLSRARLFFPDGHYSRGGFLFGHGYLVD
ncbi:MAG: DUF4124 domain-containing protein [Deltaproteobacteria bacterium]|nr:DUF4124 domain-containing protein [Deltaproteobacteria bacterium]